MIPLADGYISALCALLTIWKSDQFIVIGAAAIGCQLDFRWRGTVDLDLVIAAKPDDYTWRLERLGWRREAEAQQRWRLPDGSIVDVLPGAPTLVMLVEYVAPDAPERWSDEIVGAEMDFEDVSPFVLGRQLAALVDDSERRLVAGFLSAIDDPADRLSTLPRMARRAPASWRDEQRLRQRLVAFRRGFES